MAFVYDDANYQKESPDWSIKECFAIGQGLDDAMEIATARHRLIHKEDIKDEDLKTLRAHYLYTMLNAGVV